MRELLTRMEDGGFGRWHREPRSASGNLNLPWVELSADAKAFLARARDAGLVIASFDWVAWGGRGRYLHDPASVADASFDDCCKLLTALIRGDRFNEGLVLEAFENGLLRHLIDRLSALSKA